MRAEEGENAAVLLLQHSGKGERGEKKAIEREGTVHEVKEVKGSTLGGTLQEGGVLHGKRAEGEDLQAGAFATVEELASGKLPAADMAAHKLFQVIDSCLASSFCLGLVING